MAEYIERGAVLEKMQNWHTEERLRDCVKDFPAADVVPVVRCKDCIYNETGACEFSEGYDPNYDGEYFCANGERRDSDG